MTEVDDGTAEIGNADFLLDLPIEASDHILCYLSESDLCYMACCSRRWREMTNTDTLWKHRCKLRGWERYGTTVDLNPDHAFVDQPFTDITTADCETLVPTSKWKATFYKASKVERNWAEFRCLKETYMYPLGGHHWIHGRKDSSAYHCDGYFVVQCSSDGIHLQNLLYRASTPSEYKNGAILKCPEKHCSNVKTILLSKGIGLIVSDERDWDMVRTFDCRAARWLASFRCDCKSNLLLCLDGETVIGRCGKDDDGRCIRVWSSTEGTQQHMLQGHSREIQDLALSGDLAVSAAENLRLWDVNKGQCLRIFQCPAGVGGFTSCKIDPGHLLGGYDRTAMLSDLKSGSCITISECKPDEVKFNACLIACPMDGVAKVWSHAGNLLGTESGEMLHGLAGPRLALGHRDNWLDIRHVQGGRIQPLVNVVDVLHRTLSWKVIWMDDTKLVYLDRNDSHDMYEYISVFYFW